MMYVIFACLIIVSSYICNRNIMLGTYRFQGRNVYVLLWGIFLILLCGLRSIDIGRDTSMYAYIFQSIKNKHTLQELFENYEYFEYGYYLLNYVVSRFVDYQGFLLVSAILSIGPVIYIVLKYSKQPWMSLLLYSCFQFFTFTMSGMRQAIAMGILMLAYDCMINKKLKQYLILCFIAIMFHSSAILFIPIYWIRNIPFKKNIGIFCGTFMALTYVFRKNLWSIATVFGRQQYESNDAGGTMMYLFMILSIALGLLFREGLIVGDQENEESVQNRVLLYLQVLAAMVWPIASGNSATFRMFFYYQIFMILYVPVVIKAIPDRLVKFIVTSGYIFVSFYFLTTQVLPFGMQVNPYYFFWQ